MCTYMTALTLCLCFSVLYTSACTNILSHTGTYIYAYTCTN